MLNRVLKSLVVVSVFVGAINAQIIQNIDFTGLIHISSNKAIDLISIKVGDAMDTDKINKSIKTLYKQGYFEAIKAVVNDGVLTFETKSKPNIANIEIIGFQALKYDEALKLLGLKKGMLYDEYQITKAKKMLNAFWEYRGYLGSNVIVEKEYINENAINVKFKANRGSKVTITNFVLDGDQEHYKKATKKLKNRQKEFLGWLWGRDDGELSIAQLGKDYGALKDYYLSNGYIDVDLSKPVVQSDLSLAKANMYYKVDMGDQYKIGSVSLSDSSLYDEELKTKSGDVFNVYNLRKDIKDMQNALSKLGYAQVGINPQFKKHIENKTIDIHFDLKLGKKVYVNNVTIQGNSRTLDKVIRRELYLVPGEVYTSVNYNDSITSLRRLGYFENVIIDRDFISDDKVNITVNVTETSTGSLIGSIGYGSDGLLLNLKINDRNVFGSGIETGISLDRSSTTTKGELYFNNSRWNDSTYSLGGSLFKKQYDFSSFDEDKIGASIKVGKKITRNLIASMTYGLEKITLSDIDVNSSRLYTEGSNIKSFVTPYISYNSTDNYFLPRRGFKFSSSFQYAGLGGDMDFMKSSSKLSLFYGFEDLIGYDLILRAKANIQLAKDNGYLPINEKLYLGGLRTLRGFKTNSLSPENSYGDLTGGKRLFSSSLELSIPLIESAKMRLFGFYDYGMIGEADIKEITRSSYGWGIEWLTAMGPLQFIFSNPQNESGDSTSRFDFSIGTQF